jgi:hypothetical protein
MTGWGWLRRLRGVDRDQSDAQAQNNLPFWYEKGTMKPLADEMTLADIPVTLKRRLQEEALQTTFHRLETPLRFLLYATAPGREPESLEEYQGIVHLWRQGLEREARLLPDNFAGAIRQYEPGMEDAYLIKGRCQPGQPMRITVPAWRLHGQVVVRGEAEPFHAAESHPPANPRPVEDLAAT